MDEEKQTAIRDEKRLHFDFGTFEGFNFREQSAMWPNRTAEEVLNWDHDANGEAEFWPSGDSVAVELIFRGQSSVTANQLLELDRLLRELGGDSEENILRVYHAVHNLGNELSKLTAEEVEEETLHIFFGDCFTDMRKEAAYELFELYWPEAYAAWQEWNCDGLIFDTDRFLNSPGFCVDDVRLGDTVALLISLQ